MRSKVRVSCLMASMILIASSVFAAAAQDSPLSSCSAANSKCAEELESVWVPPGTDVWSEGAETLQFRVPEGYVVWARQNDGTFVKELAGDVTCSCAEGDCGPVNQGGVIYCAIGPKCTSCCKRSTSSAAMALVVVPENGSVNWATPGETRTLPLANHVLLEIPEISAEFLKFARKVYGRKPLPTMMTKGSEGTAPAGYSLVPINIYGYLANALVPRGIRGGSKCEVTAFSGKLVDDCGAAKETCKCNSGTSGCTHWSKFGIASGCEAGACTSCTLSVQ